MQRSAILNLKKLNLFEYVKKNGLLLVLCLLFSLGILLGAVLFSESSILQELSGNALEVFVEQRQGRGFGAIMLSSLLVSLFSLLVCYVGGASVMGIVIIPSFLALCGVGYGAFSAVLYSQYSFKGVAFNGLLVLPGFLLLAICLILAGREAMSFSIVLSRLMLPRSRPMNLSYDFKNYCGRYVVFCLATIFGAFIDSVLAVSFIKFFID